MINAEQQKQQQEIKQMIDSVNEAVMIQTTFTN